MIESQAARLLIPFIFSLGALGVAVPVTAQGSSKGVAEVSSGWAGFVDDATINHFVIGGGARWQLSPRVSVGPEVVYMTGPDDDRDFFLTGNIVVDFLEAGRAVPYLVAGGGLMVHRDRVGTGTFTSSEGAFTAGFGVRIAITDRWFVAPEARLGWELHSRVTATLGYRF